MERWKRLRFDINVNSKIDDALELTMQNFPNMSEDYADQEEVPAGNDNDEVQVPVCMCNNVIVAPALEMPA